MNREEAAHIVDVAFGVPQAVRRIGEDKTYHEDEIREAKRMAIKALEQIPDLKEAYNKGYKDGQEALAVHIELCKEEGSIVTVPEGATRRDLHKLVFGIDVPELHSDKFRCAREKGCSNCKHKDNINCDMVWWNSPYKKGAE